MNWLIFNVFIREKKIVSGLERLAISTDPPRHLSSVTMREEEKERSTPSWRVTVATIRTFRIMRRRWAPIVCVVSGGGDQRLRRQFVHQIILVERLLHKCFFWHFFLPPLVKFLCQAPFLNLFSTQPDCCALFILTRVRRRRVHSRDGGMLWWQTDLSGCAHSLCRMRKHFILKIDSSSSHSSLSSIATAARSKLVLRAKNWKRFQFRHFVNYSNVFIYLFISFFYL